uniref:EGF-like domain-containing protein n=1 Tax=Eptatretus burgeri TaxID=7764 RepID=A0A8C4Q4F7_EPTBU
MSRVRCFLAVVVMLITGERWGGETKSTRLSDITTNRSFSLSNNTCPSQFENFCVNGNCLYSNRLNIPYCICTNDYIGERCDSKSMEIAHPPSKEVIVIILLFGFFAVIIIVIVLCFIVDQRRSQRSSRFPTSEYS